MALRLDQFIANSSGLSRKEAKHAIAGGRVRVGNDVCKGASTKVAPDANVCLDDQPLSLPGERYLMLHKPAGVVSATRDSDHPTALDLLPSALVRNLHVAGRLDIDTTGLLLLSTDGPDHNVLKIKPPLCFDRNDADLLVDTMDKVLRESAIGNQGGANEKETNYSKLLPIPDCRFPIP